MRKTVISGGVALAMALAPVGALAQDDMASDEMADGDMMMGAMVPHPSHIHVGDCSMPGDVIAPLSDVGVVGNDAEGADTHIHVDIGQSVVDLPLDAILSEDHSIMVHQSADDLATILACGSIGGHDVDGSFLVGMGPVGGSGYAGIAWLTDNGDGTTDVQVTITQTGAGGMHGDMDDMSMDDDADDMSDDMSDDSMDDDMSDEDMGDDEDMDSDS